MKIMVKGVAFMHAHLIGHTELTEAQGAIMSGERAGDGVSAKAQMTEATN